MNWKQFCSLICERFPNPGAKASMELCQQLKQTSKVDHYIDQFGDWMKILKSDHHYLPQSFFLLRFLSGLKDKINHDTPLLKPATLRQHIGLQKKARATLFMQQQKSHCC
jgi:hypothetical protein